MSDGGDGDTHFADADSDFDAMQRSDAPTSMDAARDSDIDASESRVVSAGDASACNGVPELGEPPPLTCVVGAPPAMTGGSLLDGTYVLSTTTVYAANCIEGLGSSAPNTLLVDGPCMQSAADPWEPAVVAVSYSWSTSGDILDQQELCPTATPGNTMTYTASATTFVTSIPYSAQFAGGTLTGRLVDVYDKQ